MRTVFRIEGLKPSAVSIRYARTPGAVKRVLFMSGADELRIPGSALAGPGIVVSCAAARVLAVDLVQQASQAQAAAQELLLLSLIHI